MRTMRRYSASYCQSLNLVRSSSCSWLSSGTSCSNCKRSGRYLTLCRAAVRDIEAEADAFVLVCVVAPENRIPPRFTETQEAKPGSRALTPTIEALTVGSVFQSDSAQLERIVEIVERGYFQATVP